MKFKIRSTSGEFLSVAASGIPGKEYCFSRMIMLENSVFSDRRRKICLMSLNFKTKKF